MADELVLVKQLMIKEDLELGFGSTTQVRNGRNVEVTKINASVFPYQYSEVNGASITDTTQIKTTADALDYIIKRLPA